TFCVVVDSSSRGGPAKSVLDARALRQGFSDAQISDRTENRGALGMIRTRIGSNPRAAAVGVAGARVTATADAVAAEANERLIGHTAAITASPALGLRVG